MHSPFHEEALITSYHWNQREAEQDGLHLNPGLYNALLYVTTGGNNWEHYARGIEGPPPVIAPHSPHASASKPAASKQPPAPEASSVTASGAGRGPSADPQAQPTGLTAEMMAEPMADPPPTRQDLISATEAVWSHMQVRFYLCIV